MIGWVHFWQQFVAFFALHPRGRECPFFSPRWRRVLRRRGLRVVGRESDSQVFCHTNSVHASAFMENHGRHTSCPHHDHHDRDDDHNDNHNHNHRRFTPNVVAQARFFCEKL